MQTACCQARIFSVHGTWAGLILQRLDGSREEELPHTGMCRPWELGTHWHLLSEVSFPLEEARGVREDSVEALGVGAGAYTVQGASSANGPGHR